MFGSPDIGMDITFGGIQPLINPFNCALRMNARIGNNSE